MNADVVGVFIPIVMFLVVGAVIMTITYFRSRERQMLIDRGMTSEEVKQYFLNEKTSNPYLLTQIGIILIFFGMGVGFGMFVEDMTHKEYWTVLFIFTLTGAGFIAANLISRKLLK